MKFIGGIFKALLKLESTFSGVWNHRGDLEKREKIFWKKYEITFVIIRNDSKKIVCRFLNGDGTTIFEHDQQEFGLTLIPGQSYGSIFKLYFFSN